MLVARRSLIGIHYNPLPSYLTAIHTLVHVFRTPPIHMRARSHLRQLSRLSYCRTRWCRWCTRCNHQRQKWHLRVSRVQCRELVVISAPVKATLALTFLCVPNLRPKLLKNNAVARTTKQTSTPECSISAPSTKGTLDSHPVSNLSKTFDIYLRKI